MAGQRILQGGVLALALLWSTGTATAGLVISVDEFGTGLVVDTKTGASALLDVVQSPNTVPAGPLTYDIAGNKLVGLIPTPGIYALNDNGPADIQDYLVFTAQGTLQFFSQDNDPQIDRSLADQWPFPVLNPFKNISESIFGSVTVTPATGEPGALPASVGGVTYTFLSEGAVTNSEPTSAMLLGLGIVVLAVKRQRRAQL